MANYTSLGLAQWLGSNPDCSQWSFMLMPIPMFLVGVIALFGREGREDEDRIIKRPKLRWMYRLGGILVLAVTLQLAGVI
ncbi:MAG: hypothetical protein EBT07_06385 [Actinobacteria bacterium]|nr:hypothetical protein [Actinomycetota bacterium]